MLAFRGPCSNNGVVYVKFIGRFTVSNMGDLNIEMKKGASD